MNYSIKNLCTYVLHCTKYRYRLEKIKQTCNSIGLDYSIIESDIIQYSHQQNVADSLLNLLNIAIIEDKYPFLILEDDATFINHIPSSFIIPEKTDLIYWGSNKYSGPPVLKERLFIEDYNSDYYRIYNSQSAHAILIPNIKSAFFMKDICKISFDTNNFHDVILPYVSSQKIFLTPKDGPYFYQNDGRNNNVTHFKWKNFI